MRTALCRAAAAACAAAWAAAGATRYDGDGGPSAAAELLRWRVNRARFAPESEADRLGLNNASPGGHPDYDVWEDADGANNGLRPLRRCREHPAARRLGLRRPSPVRHPARRRP